MITKSLLSLPGLPPRRSLVVTERDLNYISTCMCVSVYGGWKGLLGLGQFVIMCVNVKLHAIIVSSAYKTVPINRESPL